MLFLPAVGILIVSQAGVKRYIFGVKQHEVAGHATKGYTNMNTSIDHNKRPCNIRWHAINGFLVDLSAVPNLHHMAYNKRPFH